MYSHRHGAGPLVSESLSAEFLAMVPERHNDNNLWQGVFRVGPLDFVAIKYALSLSQVDIISLTHLDYVPPNGNWEMIMSYKYGDPAVEADTLTTFFEWSKKGADIVIHAIKPHRLSPQLTSHINKCVPLEIINLRDRCGEKFGLDFGLALSDFVFERTGVQVDILSYGPCAKDKKSRTYVSALGFLFFFLSCIFLRIFFAFGKAGQF